MRCIRLSRSISAAAASTIYSVVYGFYDCDCDFTKRILNVG